MMRDDDCTDHTLLAFVIKEATYKSVSAETGRLEFSDVRVRALDGTAFSTELVGVGGHLDGHVVSGRLAVDDRYCVALAGGPAG